MKKFVVGTLIVGLALTALAAIAPYRHTKFQSVTLTTTTGSTAGSTRTDTIWFNRNLTPVPGGDVQSLSIGDYSGYRLKVTVGAQAPADTSGTVYLSNGTGLRDSMLLVVKKRVGTIVSLVDSPTSKTTAILRRASATLNSAFLIGSGATDTMFADELFGILTVADSVHDTAGVTMTYPIYSECFFKK